MKKPTPRKSPTKKVVPKRAPAQRVQAANKPTAKRGRPSLYTPEIAKEICDRLSTGEPLAEICRSEHMPAVRTVSSWKELHDGFSADFARARDEGFDAIAADCLRIANTPIQGAETKVLANGKKELTYGDMLGHRKLQIETRLKLLAKWDPRRYGDKIELAGVLGIKRDANDLTDSELAAIAKGDAKPQS